MALNTRLPSLVPTSERLKQRVELISRGYSLKPEIPDGHITVYPWDSEISDWVVTATSAQDKLFSVEIVQKLTRLPTAMMDRFVASELLMVMLVARALTAGQKLRYSARCPHCQAVQKESAVSVPGDLTVLGQKDSAYPGFDMITLPVTGDEIKFQPLRVAHLRALADKRPKGITESGSNFALSIQEVNGSLPEKTEELFQYYLALPPEDVTFLQQKSKELSPALDTRVEHRCDSEACRQKFHYNLGLHYDFFL